MMCTIKYFQESMVQRRGPHKFPKTIQILSLWFWLFCALWALVGIVGCSTTSTQTDEPDYQTLTPPPNRDTEKAKTLNEEAIIKLEAQDYEGAELDLKQALRKDITFGPAHNNLGKVYFKTKRYYLAAWEFEYAIKLMKNRPEPKNNLGLVFEAVGEMDNAVTQYQEAYQLEPESSELLGNLLRAKRKRGDKSPELKQQFKELVLKETRPEWLEWAKQQLNTVSWEQADDDQSNR